MGALWTDQKSKKSSSWSVVFSYSTEQLFLNWIVTCNEKWILCDNWWQPVQWWDWEEASKHFPKPNLHRKRVLVTVWWSAAHLILYSFLNPERSQQKRPSSLPRQCLTPCCTTSASVVEQFGLCSFASCTIFTWPFTNRLPLLRAFQQLFAGNMLPQPAGGQKMLSKS